MDFRDLPIETNGQIGSLLDDKDLCSFVLVCRDTHAAVNHDRSSVWRNKFLEKFDLVPGTKNSSLRRVYQLRRERLRKGKNFNHGRSKSEERCLQVLVSLINESFSGNSEAISEASAGSANMESIIKFVSESNIMTRKIPASREQNDSTNLILTVQVVLAHLQLNPDPYGLGHLYCRSFEASQLQVYQDPHSELLFLQSGKNEVNMLWVLHAINFFKYHITTPVDGVLKDYVENLRNIDRPRPWHQSLRDADGTLGKHWKGTYAFLDNRRNRPTRRNANLSDIHGFIQDVFNTELNDCFQNMIIDSDSARVCQRWLAKLEYRAVRFFHPILRHVAHENSSPLQTFPGYPQKLSMGTTRFVGFGRDKQTFITIGWVTPMKPQSGVPGWQRIVMIKCFLYESKSKHVYDDEILWAYEGVVLPGGMIIVGRWWELVAPDDFRQSGEYSGPFMFWNVDGPDYDDADDEQEMRRMEKLVQAAAADLD